MFLVKLSTTPKLSSHIDYTTFNSYSELYTCISSNKIHSADYFINELDNFGLPSKELYYDNTFLQNLWSRNKNIHNSFNEEDILVSQIEYYRPECIYIENLVLFPISLLDIINKKFPSIKIIVWHCTVINESILKKLRLVDGVVTCTPYFGKYFSSLKLKNFVTLYPYKYSEHPASDRLNRAMFSGSLYPGNNFHDQRCELINYLLKNDLPIDIYAKRQSMVKYFLRKTYNFFNSSGNQSIFLKYLTKNTNEKIKNLFYSPCYAIDTNSIKGSLEGNDRIEMFYNYKLILNRHAGVAGDYAGNMTLTEATGAGACLVTDMKSNLSELFKIDDEVVVYSSAEECCEKIKWLLDNPDAADNIAKNGLRRTLRDYNYEVFTRRFLNNFFDE